MTSIETSSSDLYDLTTYNQDFKEMSLRIEKMRANTIIKEDKMYMDPQRDNDDSDFEFQEGEDESEIFVQYR